MTGKKVDGHTNGLDRQTLLNTGRKKMTDRQTDSKEDGQTRKVNDRQTDNTKDG